jgi:hypothetical protein
MSNSNGSKKSIGNKENPKFSFNDTKNFERVYGDRTVTVKIPMTIEYKAHKCTFGVLLDKLKTAVAIPELSQRSLDVWDDESASESIVNFLTGKSARKELSFVDLDEQSKLITSDLPNLSGGALELAETHLDLIDQHMNPGGNKKAMKDAITDGQCTAHAYTTRFGDTAYLPIVCDPEFYIYVDQGVDADKDKASGNVYLNGLYWHDLDEVVQDAIRDLPIRFLQVRPKNRSELAKDFKDVNRGNRVSDYIPAISGNMTAFRNQNTKRAIFNRDPVGDKMSTLWSGDTLDNVYLLFERLAKVNTTVYADEHFGNIALHMNVQCRTFFDYAKSAKNGKGNSSKGMSYMDNNTGLKRVESILEDPIKSEKYTLGKKRDAEFNRIIGGYADALQSIYPLQTHALDLPHYFNAFGLVESLLHKDSVSNSFNVSWIVKDWTELFGDFILWDAEYYELTQLKRYTDEDVEASIALDKSGKYTPHFVNDTVVHKLAPEHIGRPAQIKDRTGKIVDVKRNEGYWFCSKHYGRSGSVTERNNIIMEEFFKPRQQDYRDRGIIVYPTKKTPTETYSIGDDQIPNIDINGGLSVEDILDIEQV